jgi:hypothetical protein
MRLAEVWPARPGYLVLAPIIVLLAGACARSEPAAPASTSSQLSREDPRQALASAWGLRFAVDTIDFRTALPGATVAGTLTIEDSLVGWAGRPPDLLRADFEADFSPALGRPLSCFDSTERVLTATVHGDSAELWVTPYAADCGLTISGALLGDSLSGTWFEPAYAGALSRGRVWMYRHEP